jgi:hypothetical protein
MRAALGDAFLVGIEVAEVEMFRAPAGRGVRFLTERGRTRGS